MIDLENRRRVARRKTFIRVVGVVAIAATALIAIAQVYGFLRLLFGDHWVKP